jgi:hypothetical protein
MGDPASALREAYASLDQGGIVLAIEPWSTDRLEDGIGNPLVQLDYALSTSVCTPRALAQQGRHAMGKKGGDSPRLELLTAAGFRDPIVAADTGFNLVLAAGGDAGAAGGVHHHNLPAAVRQRPDEFLRAGAGRGRRPKGLFSRVSRRCLAGVRPVVHLPAPRGR